MEVIVEARLDGRADRGLVLAHEGEVHRRQPVLGKILARRLPRDAINRKPPGQHVYGVHRAAGENRIGIGAGETEGVGTVCGESKRRIRTLHRLGDYLDGVDFVKAPAKAQAILGPRALDEREHLLEALAAGRHIYPVALIVAWKSAAPGAEVDAPARKHVERGDLLGQPHRMVPWEKGYCDS